MSFLHIYIRVSNGLVLACWFYPNFFGFPLFLQTDHGTWYRLFAIRSELPNHVRYNADHRKSKLLVQKPRSPTKKHAMLGGRHNLG